MTCRRPGANADLIEILAGRFTSLRSLTIDGFGGSDGDSDVPTDVTMVSVKGQSMVVLMFMFSPTCM